MTMHTYYVEPTIDEDKAYLREVLEQCDKTVFTLVTHVAPSGMSRSIRLFLIMGKNETRDITYIVSKILKRKVDEKNGGIKISGCGSDMGFESVYSLSIALYCPTGYEHDKAYTLKQHWL